MASQPWGGNLWGQRQQVSRGGWSDQGQQPEVQASQAPQAPAGPPPPPMQMAYGQAPAGAPQGQQATQGPGNPWNGQGAPPPSSIPGLEQSFATQRANTDWRDTNVSQAQWGAWEQQERELRARGGGAQNCPPDKPFTGRNGQCAFKPDDCPDGMRVVGNDADGSARCVPEGQIPQFTGGGGGFGGGQQQPAYAQGPQNNLLSDTYAPQLGYFGQLGTPGGGNQQSQAMGPLIQALLGMQLR